jgi:hypothetical protein
LDGLRHEYRLEPDLNGGAGEATVIEQEVEWPSADGNRFNFKRGKAVYQDH